MYILHNIVDSNLPYLGYKYIYIYYSIPVWLILR